MQNIIRQLVNTVIFFISRLNSFRWGIFLKGIGQNTFVREGVIINHPHNVTIGSNVYIGRYCDLDGFGRLSIGNYVHIASFTSIYTSNHRFDMDDIPIVLQGYVGKPVTIENNVWIGSHVVILPGVTIRTGAVIGAGSVVTKDVDKNSVVAGVPAKFIKQRVHGAKHV